MDWKWWQTRENECEKESEKKYPELKNQMYSLAHITHIILPEFIEKKFYTFKHIGKKKKWLHTHIHTQTHRVQLCKHCGQIQYIIWYDMYVYDTTRQRDLDKIYKKKY